MLLATVFLETRIFFCQNDSRVLVPQIAASILVAKKKRSSGTLNITMSVVDCSFMRFPYRFRRQVVPRDKISRELIRVHGLSYLRCTKEATHSCTVYNTGNIIG